MRVIENVYIEKGNLIDKTDSIYQNMNFFTKNISRSIDSSPNSNFTQSTSYRVSRPPWNSVRFWRLNRVRMIGKPGMRLRLAANYNIIKSNDTIIFFLKKKSLSCIPIG